MFSVLFLDFQVFCILHFIEENLFHTITAKGVHTFAISRSFFTPFVGVFISMTVIIRSKNIDRKGKEKERKISRFDHNDDFIRTYFVQFLKSNALVALLPLGGSPSSPLLKVNC